MPIAWTASSLPTNHRRPECSWHSRTSARPERLPSSDSTTAPAFIAPLERGELKGFVVQNPVNMGYLSVKTMVDHLRGQAVPATLDTGVSLVTLDNLKDPAVQAVINPPEAAGN